MKYEVTITEILQRVVTVDADSQSEAEELVQEQWNNEEHVLGAEDFVEANFDGKEAPNDGTR